ncbi:hypothetical protein [Hydrogenophaga sp.]|nr:hypothetical protein [Hydrogenophaga sp.]
MSRIPRGTAATSFLDSRPVRLAVWAGIGFVIWRVYQRSREAS